MVSCNGPTVLCEMNFKKMCVRPVALLLTWFNFDSNMDK